MARHKSKACKRSRRIKNDDGDSKTGVRIPHVVILPVAS